MSGLLYSTGVQHCSVQEIAQVADSLSSQINIISTVNGTQIILAKKKKKKLEVRCKTDKRN